MKTKRTWLALHLEQFIKRTHSTQSMSACVLIAALLRAAGALGAAGPEVDGGMPGPYPVGHTSFVSTTESGRPVAVNVWYPADAQLITAHSALAIYVMDPYTSVVGSTTSSQWEAHGYDRAYETPAAAAGAHPLVMFSPGASLNGWAYLYFGTRLASHGYIVAVVEHYGDGYWSWSFFDYFANNIYNRPGDLSFALSEMLRRNAASGDLLYQTIDRRYIIAAGHSLGGYAAMVEFSGDDQVCDSVAVNYFGGEVPTAACQAIAPDPRFTALLTLDGSAWILRWEELSRIHVPSLLIGDAKSANGEYPDEITANDRAWIARPHAALAAGTRSLRVDINNLDHLSFGSGCDGYVVLREAHMLPQKDFKVQYTLWWGCEQLLPNAEPHRLITKYAVAWLNAEVVKNGSELSKRILTQEYTLAHEPTVEVWWNERCSPAVAPPSGTFTYFIDMVPGTCAVADKNPATDFIPYPTPTVEPLAGAEKLPVDPAAAERVIKTMRRRF